MQNPHSAILFGLGLVQFKGQETKLKILWLASYHNYYNVAYFESPKYLFRVLFANGILWRNLKNSVGLDKMQY